MVRCCILFLCLGVVITATACPSVNGGSWYPTDINFKEAEKRFLNGSYREAIEYYKAFISNNTDSRYNTEALYRMGLSYRELGNNNKAQDCFQKALRENPVEFIKAKIFYP